MVGVSGVSHPEEEAYGDNGQKAHQCMRTNCVLQYENLAKITIAAAKLKQPWQMVRRVYAADLANPPFSTTKFEI